MEHVYVMRNPRSYNDIKVGFSINPINRQKQLYKTNTPLPFLLEAVWAVNDQRQAEKIAHAVLQGHRINDRREWFEIAPVTSSLWTVDIQSDYDTTSVYLEALIEQIEDGFKFSDIKYSRILNYEDLEEFISLDNIKFLK